MHEHDECCGEEYGPLLIGETFPEFSVKTTMGKMNLPDAFKGKWFVFFSHPADFTPVCTTEFAAFAKKHDEFRKINCELIGLSVDQVFSHIKWVEWINEKLGIEVTFPVIADELGIVAERLGMLHPAKGSNTVRGVVFVDPEAKVRAILYYPQELGRNIDEIMRMVRALQISDKEKVAMPANWPHNEIVGDNVIVPPPTDVHEAHERPKKYECLDWWFCKRKL